MTPLNYLCRAAKHAKAGKTNYVLVVRGCKVLAEGADLQAALNTDVRGAVLYSFRELTPAELGRAEAAGIKSAYYGVTRHVAKRIGLWPAHLRQRAIRYCRDTIMAEYVATWKAPLSTS
jgi:hypothetical protein